MPNDTSLQSIFDYAKQLGTGGDFPTKPTVYATYVAHYANLHPPGGADSADLVYYATGPLTLSGNQKSLSGEFKLWRNSSDPFAGSSALDVFPDSAKGVTIALTVSDTGQVTHQIKKNGAPLNNLPPSAFSTGYEAGLFVEKNGGIVMSLSFTLGNGPA